VQIGCALKGDEIPDEVIEAVTPWMIDYGQNVGRQQARWYAREAILAALSVVDDDGIPELLAAWCADQGEWGLQRVVLPAAAPPDLPEHLPTQLWLSERDGVSRIGRGPVVDERALEMGYREFVADVSNWRPVVPAAAPEIAGVEPSALGGGRSAGNARSTLRRDQARPRTTTTSADSNLGSAPACPACGSTDRAERRGVCYLGAVNAWHSVPAAAPEDTGYIESGDVTSVPAAAPEPKYEYRVVCPDGEACSMHVDFPAHGLAENDDVHCLHDEPGLHGVERREVGAWHSVEEGKE